MSSTSELKPSACVLCLNSDGQPLMVRRKKDMILYGVPTAAFGLPGGKVDPGETLEECAIREAKEETGLDVFNLRQIYQADDGQGYLATCFLADWKGELSPREGEPPAQWGMWMGLFERSPFGKYNFDVFKAWKKYLGDVDS